tara:strand:- start:6353 stop:6706 length:354 start_codon:yes stop_codon:yes gene_type:complete
MSIRKQAQTVLPSAARTATVVSGAFSAEEVVFSTFSINVSAVTATPSVVFSIEGKDPLSGVFYNIIDSAAITATGISSVLVGASINEMLPQEYRVTATHGDADSITYSVGVVHMVQN